MTVVAAMQTLFQSIQSLPTPPRLGLVPVIIRNNIVSRILAKRTMCSERGGG
jgi:hypothetical protein